MLVQLLYLAVHTFVKDGQLPFDEMVQALHSGLEPQHAAHHCQHTSQSNMENMSEFIQRLAQTFMIAFGQDQMSLEKGKPHVHSGTGS